MGSKTEVKKKKSFQEEIEQEIFIACDACEDLTILWQDHWLHCPFCRAYPDEEGIISHVKIRRNN